MSAHTPEPWAMTGRSITDGSISIGAGRCVVASVHNGVSLSEIMFDREPETQLANARLITSAPDLLVALQYARRMMKADSDFDFVDAAISKATGSAA